MSATVQVSKPQVRNKAKRCIDPRTGQRFRKHQQVEHGFYVYCKRCGKVFKCLIKDHKYKIKPKKEYRPQVILRIELIYPTLTDKILALERKMKVLNERKGRIDLDVIEDIQALSEAIEYDKDQIQDQVRENMPITITKGKSEKKIKSKKISKAAKIEKKVKEINDKDSGKIKPLAKTLKSKTCTKCKKHRPIDKFGKRIYKGRTYYQSQCVDCR